jgi:hypothetical protein
MPEGRKVRASNKSPRAEGRGPRASDAAPEALLRELLERSRRALTELDAVFVNTKGYLNNVIDDIVKERTLTEKDKIIIFKNTMPQLLDLAHSQAKERLNRVILGIESGNSRIDHCSKTYRIWVAEEWSTSVSIKGSVRLPIHGISACVYFPKILNVPDHVLTELQLGWAASDEGRNGGKGSHPLMRTTHVWQLLFWLATRYGRANIAIGDLFLRKREGMPHISIGWRAVAKDWPYLPKEGRKNRENVREPTNPVNVVSGGRKNRRFWTRQCLQDQYRRLFREKTISIASEILREAYKHGIGQPLDLLARRAPAQYMRPTKWEALKRLAARVDLSSQLFELAESPPLP